MVSITPCLPKLSDVCRAWPVWARRVASWLLYSAVCAVLLGVVVQPVAAQTPGKQSSQPQQAQAAPAVPPVTATRTSAPAITDTRFDLGEDGVRMSGNIHFTLSARLQETLDRGVPVYFLFETQTTRSRWYWTGKVIHTNKRYVRLLYQPLTRRWRVNVSSEPINRGSVGVMLSQNFDSLEVALGAVRRISSWQVLPAAEWEPDGSYMVRARLRLDVSQLGQTFQGGPAWQSGWGLDVDRTFPLTAKDLGKTVSGLSGMWIHP